MVGTVKPRLQGCMFTCATLTVVFINDQCPRLSSSFESLRNAGDGILFGLGGIMVVVEGDVHISSFIVDGLNPSQTGFIV